MPQIRQPRDASGVISSNDDGKFFFFYFDVNNSIFNDICFALVVISHDEPEAPLPQIRQARDAFGAINRNDNNGKHFSFFVHV